jgi:hypothetical protein
VEQNVIRMTRPRGVEIIKYEPHLELGNRPTAATHHSNSLASLLLILFAISRVMISQRRRLFLIQGNRPHAY